MKKKEDNQPQVFEIHVGFPHRAIRLFNRLAATESTAWKALEVCEVVDGPASMGLFDAHDVPGVLALMATKRVWDEEVARAEVNRIAGEYAHESDVRIELEQVLMTDEGSSTAMALPTSWSPVADDFPEATLIPETPPFETHFSLKPGFQGGRLGLSTRAGIDLASAAGIPVHQAVRFSTEDQVILTTFFESYAEMADSTASFADLYRRRLANSGGVRLKVVAERIVACIQPTLLKARSALAK